MLLLKFWQKQTARFVCRRLVLQVRTMSEETKEQPQILKWASKTGEFVRNPSSFRYFCAHTLDPWFVPERSGNETVLLLYSPEGTVVFLVFRVSIISESMERVGRSLVGSVGLARETRLVGQDLELRRVWYPQYLMALLPVHPWVSF